MWWTYALLSALFASLTAIFAKIGVADIKTAIGAALIMGGTLVLIL